MTIHTELSVDSGAPGSTLAMAEIYRRHGHEVELFSFGDLPSGLRGGLRELAFPWYVAFWVRRRLRSCPADVIDSSSGDSWVWSRLVGRGARRRPVLVMRSHGLEHEFHEELTREARAQKQAVRWRYRVYRGSWRLREVAITCRDADVAMFLNASDREYAVTRLGASPVGSNVVRNGLPDDLIGLPVDLSARSPIGVAMLGSAVARKGFRYALPALERLFREFSDLRVSLLGTGSSAEEVLRSVHPDYAHRFSVVPSYRREDLPSLLSRDHIVLSASYSEGFGKGLLEGMACGLAAVAADAAGPREILSNGSGLLVAARDDVAIERALRRLLLDAALLRSMRQSCYERAQEYAWESVGRERLQLVVDACAGPTVGRGNSSQRRNS
jgi:glycosyltransferase involved in cell wall biosynthesis